MISDEFNRVFKCEGWAFSSCRLYAIIDINRCGSPGICRRWVLCFVCKPNKEFKEQLFKLVAYLPVYQDDEHRMKLPALDGERLQRGAVVYTTNLL